MSVICIFFLKLFDGTETLITSVKAKEVLNQKSPLLVKHIKWSHLIESRVWNEYLLNGKVAQPPKTVDRQGKRCRQAFSSNGDKAWTAFTREVEIQHAIEETFFQILFHTDRILKLKIIQQNIEQKNKGRPSSTEHSTSNLRGPVKMTSTKARSLESCYKLLQADLKRSPVNYIQTVYKDHEIGKIVVDINKGNYHATYKALKNLPNSDQYYEYLDVTECDAGELLMQAGHLSNLESDIPQRGHPQYNVCVGTGSLIGCSNIGDEDLQGLIKDKDMKSINDILRKYPSTSTGTLTCIVKHKAKYYTMTAQHVLDKHQFSSDQKQIFSQVHLECPELLLADIVHLASCYSGRMSTISLNDCNKAVDVTLMPVRQNHLDVTLLERLTVYCRANLEDATQDSDTVLMNKYVRKIGAITGDTQGEIISTDCMAPLDPGRHDSPQGEMFAVVSKTNQPFAQKGDSGSLVTIQLKQNGRIREYALGIIAQRRPKFLRKTNVTLCVRMEDCLKALESATVLGETIDSTALELYAGFLRPFAGLHDRTMAHVEVASASEGAAA